MPEPADRDRSPEQIFTGPWPGHFRAETLAERNPP